MNITKMLTISTAHITRETEKKLRVESYSNNMCLSVYDKEGYGYWIYIDPYDKLMCKKNIPEDLLKCIELARQNDCQWLCLDWDAEEVSELPTYD